MFNNFALVTVLEGVPLHFNATTLQLDESIYSCFKTLKFFWFLSYEGNFFNLCGLTTSARISSFVLSSTNK